MNILLLGSGGREHAFAWKISQSQLLSKLYIAPGNGGTATVGENVSLNLLDFDSIRDFCLEKKIEMIVVGPEDPLVNGIADYFAVQDDLKIPVIGPVKEGARLEGSKDFAKAFMKRHGIPTAAYHTFTLATAIEGEAFLDRLSPPFVLKADGLAAGKGVLILNKREEAKQQLLLMLNGMFGSSSSKVVIEQFLKGIELSVFVLTDGKNYKILPAAKDYKRIGENDEGPNTGGMGAVSPVPFADANFLSKVEQRIVVPTIQGLKDDGIDYRGFIFIGLMNVEGDPYVIEYNVRMGDPETEAVLPRINNDIIELFNAVASQKLGEVVVDVDPRTAATVVTVSNGYPGDYLKGKEITRLELIDEALVFHAGTTVRDNMLVTNGGRVFAVTAMADTIEDAVEAALKGAGKIAYEGKYYRRDIGKDLMEWKKVES